MGPAARGEERAVVPRHARRASSSARSRRGSMRSNTACASSASTGPGCGLSTAHLYHRLADFSDDLAPALERLGVDRVLRRRALRRRAVRARRGARVRHARADRRHPRRRRAERRRRRRARRPGRIRDAVQAVPPDDERAGRRDAHDAHPWREQDRTARPSVAQPLRDDDSADGSRVPQERRQQRDVHRRHHQQRPPRHEVGRVRRRAVHPRLGLLGARRQAARRVVAGRQGQHRSAVTRATHRGAVARRRATDPSRRRPPQRPRVGAAVLEAILDWD